MARIRARPTRCTNMEVEEGAEGSGLRASAGQQLGTEHRGELPGAAILPFHANHAAGMEGHADAGLAADGHPARSATRGPTRNRIIVTPPCAAQQDGPPRNRPVRRHRGRPRRLNDARKPEAGLPGAGAMCLLCDRCAPLANSVPIGTGTVFSFWELCIIALTGKLRVPKYEQQPGCRNWSGRRRYLER